MPEGANLEDRLNNYETAASATAAVETWKMRLGAWPLYAAAAGSALAHSTAASAAIIYSGPQNVTASVTNIRSLTGGTGGIKLATATVNIDALGNVFKLRQEVVKTSSVCCEDIVELSANGGARRLLETYPGSFPVVRRLASGALISSRGSFGNFGPLFCDARDICETSPWPFQQNTGFAGVEFTQGGQNHFGWIRLKFDVNRGLPDSITAIDWAYNTVPGAPIAAGEGATPEPDTAGLALLSLGFLGVLAWRRSRRETAVDRGSSHVCRAAT